MGPEDWKRKRDAIRHYDKLAHVYDDLYKDEQNLKIKLALETVPIRSRDLVLDVGCGTGFLFGHIGESVDLVVGVDVSFGLLKIASVRSEHYKMKPFVCLVRADADHLPFPHEIFNKVFAFTLLQNMTDIGSALLEVLRVSKNDSTIVVTGLKKFFSEQEFSRILKEADLEFSVIGTMEKTKDIIAVCRKTHGSKG